MGKARRNRVRQRLDPLVKSIKPPSEPDLAAIRENKILPVIKNLQSPDSKSRTAAAGAIANIVHDFKCRKLLLREQVVHIVLTQTLTDTSIESRAAGWDILSVLAQEEECDFCVHLHRLGILASIEHAAKTIVDTLLATEPAFSKLWKAQQKLVWDISMSLLSLLAALSLARDEITEALAKNQAVRRFLFRLTTLDVTPVKLLTEALSCLMALSGDSLTFGQAIVGDPDHCYSHLVKLSTGTDLKAVLACGVLHNVFSSLTWLDHSSGKDGACDAMLVRSLSSILERTDLGKMQDDEQKSSATEILQVALEVLASIGTNLQDSLVKGSQSRNGTNKIDEASGEWDGFDDGNDAMDVDGEAENSTVEPDEDDTAGGDGESEDGSEAADFDEDMEKVVGTEDDEDGPGATDLSDYPTLRDLIQTAVPQLIRLSIAGLDCGEYPMVVQGHALAALNNIAWTIACIDFSQENSATLLDVWAPAAKRIWRKCIALILESESADLGLATAVTSLAWAVSKSLGGSTPLLGNEHRRFFSLYQVSKESATEDEDKKEGGEHDDPFQSLRVKCIGVLGSMARDPAPIHVNREIGVFLVTLLTNADTPPAEIVESLTQIFDLYGDETVACDREVFWKDNFLQHLETFLPKAKKIGKGVRKGVRKGVQKGGQTELRSRMDEAIVNLTRFIGYKKKHMPKAEILSGSSQNMFT